MPITNTVTETYTLRSISVDVKIGRATAVFIRMIDGVEFGETQVIAEGADLLALLGGTPDATKSRADDVTDAVYAYAISSGAIGGVIV